MAGNIELLKRSLRACDGCVNDHDAICACRPVDVRLALKLLEGIGYEGGRVNRLVLLSEGAARFLDHLAKRHDMYRSTVPAVIDDLVREWQSREGVPVELRRQLDNTQ